MSFLAWLAVPVRLSLPFLRASCHPAIVFLHWVTCWLWLSPLSFLVAFPTWSNILWFLLLTLVLKPTASPPMPCLDNIFFACFCLFIFYPLSWKSVYRRVLFIPELGLQLKNLHIPLFLPLPLLQLQAFYRSGDFLIREALSFPDTTGQVVIIRLDRVCERVYRISGFPFCS